MKKVEEAAIQVAALASVDGPLNSYHLRTDRRLKTAAREAYERLAEGQKTDKKSPVYAQLDWETGATARGYKLGVEEFSRRHPKMAKELRGTIEEQRDSQRVYVSWKVRSAELPKSYVMGVLSDLGMTGAAAETTYQAINHMTAGMKAPRSSVLIGQ